MWRELGLRSGTRQCQRVQVAKPAAKSHDAAMDDAAFDNALIAAAFQLAAEQGWRRVSVVAAARAAGLPLARARERFPGRSAILLRFGRLADQAALAEAPSEGPVRDRLFDLLMRRIDALQTHRAGVLALLRALPAEPPTALLLALATRRSMRWMLAAAGIPDRRHSWRTAGEGPAGGLALDAARLARRRRRGPGDDHGGARCGATASRAGGRMARLACPRGGSAAGYRRAGGVAAGGAARGAGLSLVALPPIKGARQGVR